ncbi:hypothetical protein AB0D49_33265 [Streptomyces sp. NPDC048290]|uniref:hypothetical protein n=1 Tax=Streptomyces sp. NPDC048290 TaxID=3155811 RepID=UPI00343CE941
MGGPRDLWESVEAAYRLWQRLNRPRRGWFTIEATAGHQTVSYTTSAGHTLRWTL